MNRFAAVSLFNTSLTKSEHQQSSYKQALLNILQQQSLGDNAKIWLDTGDLAQAVSEDSDLRPDKAIDYTEMRSRNFNDGPGEMDMLLGFFVMNGACIIFFLTFGMCVICSCMRRRPKFVANDEPSQAAPLSKAPPVTTITVTTNNNNLSAKTKIRKFKPRLTKQVTSPNGNGKPVFVAPPPITSPMLKPTFKAIVARAMEQQKLTPKPPASASLSFAEKNNSLAGPNFLRDSGSSASKSKTTKPLLDDRVECTKPNQVSVQIEDLTGLSPQQNCIKPDLRNDSRSPIGAVKQQAQDEEADTASTETSSDDEPSVVRQNLLGPLTFDDLYYA